MHFFMDAPAPQVSMGTVAYLQMVFITVIVACFLVGCSKAAQSIYESFTEKELQEFVRSTLLLSHFV